jgi:hypothetical protein
LTICKARSATERLKIDNELLRVEVRELKLRLEERVNEIAKQDKTIAELKVQVSGATLGTDRTDHHELYAGAELDLDRLPV